MGYFLTVVVAGGLVVGITGLIEQNHDMVVCGCGVAMVASLVARYVLL